MDANQLSFTRARTLLLGGALFHAENIALESLNFFSATDHPIAEGSLLSFPVALSTVSLLTIALFLSLEKRWRLSRLGLFVAPVGAIFMLFSGIIFHLSPQARLSQDWGLVLWTHIICWVISLLFLAFCFLLSLAVIVKESLLKRKKFTPLQQNLPSLNALERLLGVFFSIGLLAMLVGLLSGILYAYESGVSRLLLDPRFVWSLVTASIYLGLFVARSRHGLRGTRAAWLHVAGFATLVLSFIGVGLIGGGFHVY